MSLSKTKENVNLNIIIHESSTGRVQNFTCSSFEYEEPHPGVILIRGKDNEHRDITLSFSKKV